MSNRDEKGSIETIVTGTLSAGAVGAIVGASAAILTNAPIKQFAISTGINCGAFGATFFVVREAFVVSQRKKNPQFGFKDSQTRNYDDFVSSTLAGFTSGGILSAVYRGPRGVLPGAVIFGLLGASLQTVYTAGNQWRQEKILGHKQEPIQKPTQSFWEYLRMPSWSPIRILTDDEYTQILDTRLKELELEVKELEQKLKEDTK